MFSANKPMTHIVWAQYYQGGKFRKWVELGEGRIDIDASGKATAHVFTNRIPRGDNGYLCLTPTGMKPPDPVPQAIRPGQNDQDDF